MVSVLDNVFQKTEAGETLSNFFYEVYITLTLNPNKNITRNENHRLISLININAKIFLI